MFLPSRLLLIFYPFRQLSREHKENNLFIYDRGTKTVFSYTRHKRKEYFNARWRQTPNHVTPNQLSTRVLPSDPWAAAVIIVQSSTKAMMKEQIYRVKYQT